MELARAKAQSVMAAVRKLGMSVSKADERLMRSYTRVFLSDQYLIVLLGYYFFPLDRIPQRIHFGEG